MATIETKNSMVKFKPNSQNVPSKPKIDSSSLNKKLSTPTSIKHSSDSKIKSVTTVTKSEVKSKPITMASSSKTISKTKTTTKKTTTTKVRERKVYNLAGQKHDPPEQKEPLRIFYESLLKQIPTSEMAEFWLMEHGLLSPDKAKKAFEKKQRKQKELRTGTPVKSWNPPTKTGTSQKIQQKSNNPGTSQKQQLQQKSNNTGTSQKQQQKSNNGDIKAKKRILPDSDDDDDDDFILSHKRRKAS